MKNEFLTDPNAALTRLLVRQDSPGLEMEAACLAELLPAAACREQTLLLLEKPDPSARIIALALAGRWLACAPAEAIRTLDARNPTALCSLLEARPYLIQSAAENLGGESARVLLSGIRHPAARATALKQLNVRFPPPAKLMEDALVHLTAMHPSPAGDAAAEALATDLRTANTPPPTALIRKVLALDPEKHGGLCDDLLESIAQRDAPISSGTEPALPEIVRSIRDPAKRLALLTDTLPARDLPGCAVELMDLLAGFPAGDDRTRGLAAYPRQLSPASCLRAATGPHPPCVRAPILTALLENADSRIKAAAVMEALATLPPDWQTADLRRKLRAYRAASREINPTRNLRRSSPVRPHGSTDPRGSAPLMSGIRPSAWNPGIRSRIA